MTAKLTFGERRAIVTLNETLGSLSLTARTLGICAGTLDRVVMGCRVRPSTLERVRAGLATWTKPVVHTCEAIQ